MFYIIHCSDEYLAILSRYIYYNKTTFLLKLRPILSSCEYYSYTDGYNTESPERLHIDFTKAAYRTSNKCDYMEQMSIWLQCQEAMWLKDSYLMWVNHDLPSLLKRPGMDDSDGNEDELDVEDDGEDQQGAVDVPITLRPISDGPFWQVAKTPSYPNMLVEHLRTRFGVQDFISQLSLSVYLAQPFLQI